VRVGSLLQATTLAAEGFRELRRPERRPSTDEVRLLRETLHFYTKNDDLQAIYEELLAHQQELQGSENCFGLRRGYGTDPEQIASLRINARDLPTISIRAVPLMAEDLDVIAKAAGLRLPRILTSQVRRRPPDRMLQTSRHFGDGPMGHTDWTARRTSAPSARTPDRSSLTTSYHSRREGLNT